MLRKRLDTNVKHESSRVNADIASLTNQLPAQTQKIEDLEEAIRKNQAQLREVRQGKVDLEATLLTLNAQATQHDAAAKRLMRQKVEIPFGKFSIDWKSQRKTETDGLIAQESLKALVDTLPEKQRADLTIVMETLAAHLDLCKPDNFETLPTEALDAPWPIHTIGSPDIFM